MKIKWFLLTIVAFTQPVFAAESERWDKTIKKVTDAVVSIRVNAVRPFDTESSMVTQATGFVVDAKRGIILTNRHVVNPGPITAEAIFSNSEEIDLIPIYRDPVHDFGFFKYDPEALEFIKPQALKLNDNSAKIGDEIKVIGNDSGEHMSILSGTLARLDRSAPKYRRGGYNDFNTFYFQSAADTSGGSSGSPVVNINAEVIALNAGGNNRSSSSFFLPLFKITRALEAIQKEKPISRGSLETTFKYQPYDQARRLGLTSELEAQFRKRSQGDGVLTVEQILHSGVADKLLRPGDILIALNTPNKRIDFVTRYEQLEIFLDQNVGSSVEVSILRRGTPMTLQMKVTDLRAITPDAFIEVGGGVFNNLSYQIARQTNLPIKGVYIASAGYMFSNSGLNRGTVIQSINNQEVNDLTAFKNALSSLKQDDYFKVTYINIANPNSTKVANVRFQSIWHVANDCHRNDKTGVWPCSKIELNASKKEPEPTKVKFKKHKNKKVNQISRSLVMVRSALPYHIDGQNYPSYTGTGLVVDAEAGLVVTDRNTVPLKMAQVDITVAGVAEIPAEVLFIHPLHAFALLKYDPKLIKSNEIRSAPINSKPLESGDIAWMVGYQTSNRIISEKVSVSSFDPLVLPPPPIPQFREANISAVTINNPPAIASGVLLDKRGKVRSWWTNFAYGRGASKTIDRGLPVRYIESLRDQWLEKGAIDIYSLEVELMPITLSSARKYGLTDNWFEEFQENGSNAQVLQVNKAVAGSDAFKQLKEGDLLLAIDDKPVNNFANLDASISKAQVKVSIWRNNQQLDLKINTRKLSNTDTLEAYIWAGALLQKPHRALSSQHGIDNQGVYVSWYWYGSPANRHNLRPLNRITELDGEPVTDMAQFIALSQKLKNKKYLSVRLIDLIGRESIITIKQDQHYWPTQRIYWEGKSWKNELIK